MKQPSRIFSCVLCWSIIVTPLQSHAACFGFLRRALSSLVQRESKVQALGAQGFFGADGTPNTELLLQYVLELYRSAGKPSKDDHERMVKMIQGLELARLSQVAKSAGNEINTQVFMPIDSLLWFSQAHAQVNFQLESPTVEQVYNVLHQNQAAIQLKILQKQRFVDRRIVALSKQAGRMVGMGVGAAVGIGFFIWLVKVPFSSVTERMDAAGRQGSFEVIAQALLDYNFRGGEESQQRIKKFALEINTGKEANWKDYEQTGINTIIWVPALVSILAQNIHDAALRKDSEEIALTLRDLYYIRAALPEYFNNDVGLGSARRVDKLFEEYDPNRVILASIESGAFDEHLKQNRDRIQIQPR